MDQFIGSELVAAIAWSSQTLERFPLTTSADSVAPRIVLGPPITRGSRQTVGLTSYFGTALYLKLTVVLMGRPIVALRAPNLMVVWMGFSMTLISKK